MWEIATLGNSLTFTYFASCVACVYVCLFIYLFRKGAPPSGAFSLPSIVPPPSEAPTCVESLNLSHLSTPGWLRSIMTGERF